MLESIPSIYLAAFAITIGFIGLMWSADRFVVGSAAIACSFGLAPIIVGLTIVSLGTSAPEIAVSISASLKDNGELAIGNALGSNIANIALVLAVTALITKIPIQTHILKHEMPVLFGVTVVSGLFLFDATLQTWEGLVLAGLMIPVMWYLVKNKRQELTPEELAEEQDIPKISRLKALIWFFVGLVALMLSSEVLVWGAKTTAEFFGVSQLVIGLTIVALGTSLPELAASVTSALKGHHDIALGNIVGSNIFNMLTVMAIPGIISPPLMENAVFNRDYLAMMAVTILLIVAIFAAFKSKQRRDTPSLGRISGGLLLCCYLGYLFFIATT